MDPDVRERRELPVPVGGLGFPESPRWHDGRLWFVDLFRGRVLAAEPGHTPKIVAEIDDDVAGLGFLPDGTPLAVSGNRRRILKLLPGGATATHADLSAAGHDHLNDMVVGPGGRAYVDAITHLREPADEGAHDALIVVEPDGSWNVAAEGLARPNGLALRPDGRTLIQASTKRRELIAWAVDGDGALSDPCLWAAPPGITPDGICGDAADGIWVAGLESGRFVRVDETGHVTDTVDVAPRWAIACVLGGDDGCTLFLLTAEPGQLPIRAHPETHRGHVEAVRVDIPGAGRP